MQQRVGKEYKLFQIYKFRTMEPPSSNHPKGRVTRFGSFMRKWRIDEIPQIVNILRGEMAFFGPRALASQTFDELPADVKIDRACRKPGWLSPVHVIEGPLTLDAVVAEERAYFSRLKREGALSVHTKILVKVAYIVIFKGARGRMPAPTPWEKLRGPASENCIRREK